MGSQVLDGEAAAALDQIHAGLDALSAAGVDPLEPGDAITWVREVEAVARRARSVQLDVVDVIDRKGLHRADGHASAKVMVRHNAHLSEVEALRRSRSAKALRDLPAVKAGLAAGEVGVCHVDRIARAHANPRIRDAFCAEEAAFARAARVAGYRAFDAAVTDWVRLTDADGTCDTAERNHQNRAASLVQNPDGSWSLRARCGSLQGAGLRSIFDRFIGAEFRSDWTDARHVHGEDACAEDLARTDEQRRMDALDAIFQDAASAAADAAGGSQIVTNIVIDHATFETLVAGIFGADPDPGRTDAAGDVAFDPGPAGGPDDGVGVGFRCSTTDGHPIDPTEAVTNALLGHVRRVVIGADSVVIDLGRRRRLFTGAAQLAARLAATECYWPGCHVPVTGCQTDHLLPWADHGGRTDPGNGGPACGKHNRQKQRGYTVRRDPTGQWHTYRPDGTEIT